MNTVLKCFKLAADLISLLPRQKTEIDWRVW